MRVSDATCEYEIRATPKREVGSSNPLGDVENSAENQGFLVFRFLYLSIKFGGADEILDQMRSLTGGGHAHVFLRRTIEGRSALYPV